MRNKNNKKNKISDIDKILGNPQPISLGGKPYYIYPCKVKDYEVFAKGLSIVGLESFQLHELLMENTLTESIEREHKYIEDKDLTLFDVLQLCKKKNAITSPIVYSLLLVVVDFFELVFQDSTALDAVASNEEFDLCKEIIREINGISYKKPSANPEIRYWEEVKERMNKDKGHSIDFEQMFTSIVVQTGMSPNIIKDDFTIYMFMRVFKRIEHFKNFEISIHSLGGGTPHLWYAGDEKEKAPRKITHGEIYNNQAKKIK